MTTAEAEAYPVWSSYYSWELAGYPTASGVPFDPMAHTCAHRSYAFGTVLYLESDGFYSWCVVNDWGPAYWTGRDLDVSLIVAQELTLDYEGVDWVDVYAVY